MNPPRTTPRHGMLVARRLLPWSHRRLAPQSPSVSATLLRHPVLFFRQLLCEHASPAELGKAAALGVFIGATPAFSLHTVIIIFAARRMRMNVVMAVASQNVCIPPFVPFLCVELGYFIRHGQWLQELSMDAWVYQAHLRIWEWLLGSLVAGPVLAALVGFLVFNLAVLVRRKAQA